MIRSLNTIAPYLDIAAPLISIFFMIFRKEKRLGEHIFIVFYIILQLLLNSWAKSYMYLKMENGFIYQINCTASLIILSAYFLLQHKPNTGKRTFLILGGLSILSVIITFTIVRNENISIFNSRSCSFVAVMISLHAIIYFYLKLVNPTIEKITMTRSFWFTTGLLTYYSGSFFIVATYRSFIQYNPDDNFPILWSMHNVIFLLMCISISIGFRCKNYQMT